MNVQPSEGLHLRLGALERKRKRFHEAIKHFVAAHSLNPNRAITYIAKAECLAELKQFRYAKKALNQSLRIERRPDALVQLGSICETINQKTYAIRHYNAALSLEPRYEEAHYNLGRLLRTTSPKEALFHIRRAIVIDPEYALAHGELGILLIQLRRFKSAEYAKRGRIITFHN